MASTSGAPRLWSTAFSRSAARLLAVGVATGAATGALLGLLLVLLGRAWAYPLTVDEVAGPVVVGTLARAACALPVVALCAVTGLVVAAKAPGRSTVVLALLVVWPVVLTTWTAFAWFAEEPVPDPLRPVLAVAVLVTPVWVTVVRTHRWVLAPLRGAAPPE